MTTAFVGLLLGVLVVSVVGIWSARIARNESKAKATMQAERTHTFENRNGPLGPNEGNPNARAMAGATGANRHDSEPSPYSGS